MWMEEQKNGKYKFVERYIDPYTEKQKKVSVTMTSKSRQAFKEAQRILNTKIDDLTSIQNQINKDILFVAMKDEWLTRYKKMARNSSSYSAEYALNSFFEYIPAQTKLYKVDHIILNKAFDKLLYDKDLSNQYVKRIKTHVNSIFKYAISIGYLQNNPVEKVDITFKQKEFVNTRKLFLNDDEYNELIKISYEKNKMYGLLFQWLYLNGLRAGEALGMKINDVTIDDENNIYQVEINGTLQYHGKKIDEQFKTDKTKTLAGMRTIDLSQKAIEVYNEVVTLSNYNDSDFLFSTSKGTPVQITAINTFLREYVKPKMNIDKNISSHIFRHTHVSKLAELGVPLYAIQDRVGHENSKITESIYLHVTNNVREKLKLDIEKL